MALSTFHSLVSPLPTYTDLQRKIIAKGLFGMELHLELEPSLPWHDNFLRKLVLRITLDFFSTQFETYAEFLVDFLVDVGFIDFLEFLENLDGFVHFSLRDQPPESEREEVVIDSALAATNSCNRLRTWHFRGRSTE